MSKRVSPTERVRAEIDDLFGSDRTLTEVLEEVARLSVRLVMQAGVEAEVDTFLQRVRYERRSDEHPSGSRNGWQPPATVKTTMGPVAIQRPKLRDTDEKFCSRLLGKEVTRTNALEALVISGWVRGRSDRDIEAALAEVLGPEASLSRSTVSRICQRIKEEFAEWKERDLSGIELDYHARPLPGRHTINSLNRVCSEDGPRRPSLSRTRSPPEKRHRRDPSRGHPTWPPPCKERTPY